MMSSQRKRLYNSWHGMLSRAAGVGKGRGRPICETWRRSFDAFARDVGSPPCSSRVLCLRDPDAGFIPGNVFWGTRVQRQQYVAHANQLTFRGRTLSLSAWARELGISAAALRSRLETRSVAEALGDGRHARRDGIGVSTRFLESPATAR